MAGPIRILGCLALAVVFGDFVVQATESSTPQQAAFLGNGAEELDDILDKLQFLNGPSVVTCEMHFQHYEQCVKYAEPENATKPVHGWVTPRLGPAPFLYQVPEGVPPPLGMRSAVPLGGLGTGSLEIRADGSFHEWTLENQSPGGSAKLGPGPLDLAVIGVRVSGPSGSKSALVRTHPPEGYPGVQGISYAGAFPVSKLGVRDERFFGVRMDLFAYGTLHLRQSAESAVPAIMFTLKVSNPTEHDVTVSFLLNLPLGLQTDTARLGGTMDVVRDVGSVEKCAALCNAKKRCMAWSYKGRDCRLKDTMPLHAYRRGTSSGVKGNWEMRRDGMTCARPGKFPNSGSTTVLSTHDDPSFAVSDDFKSIWRQFEDKGHLTHSTHKTQGFHGSTSVSARLPAGRSETFTLIVAWNYPYRDHSGDIVGQYYSNLFDSSLQAARHARADLVNNLEDILSFQSSIFPPKSPASSTSLPDWLQDHLVNSLSFWRSGFRLTDGRWRQWEAFDCNDVDSVHNDFQRALPYALFYPDLLENVVRAWARYQDPNGMIQETLQQQRGCQNRTNPLDSPGGRIMADVTPAFLAQVYLLYKWTGNDKLLRDLWPAVSKATVWLMRNSTNGTGLPLRLSCTYDIIYLEKYDHTTYNSVMYLLGLRAAEELGRMKGDEAFSQRCVKAFRRGRRRLVEKLWDGAHGYFHAWWDHERGSPHWLMADSLYGQVWAYALGLGSLLDKKKMLLHLRREKELNETPYGLRVLTKFRRRGRRRRMKRVRANEDILSKLEGFYSQASRDSKTVKSMRSARHAKKRRMKEHQSHTDTGSDFSDGRKNHFEASGAAQKRSNHARTAHKDGKKTNTTPAGQTLDGSYTRVTQATLPHTDCFSLDKKFMFNSIWMGSDSDWATLQIYLGTSPDVALNQAEKGLEHYRTGLQDLWNIHGLSAGPGHGLDGQPWCTSHYTFHMVLWHIPLAISGQQYSAIKRSLRFDPRVKVPYVLPFFTPFASGLVESSTQRGKVLHKVTVMLGKLELKSLKVSRSKYSTRHDITLKKGEYVEWTGSYCSLQ